VRLIRKVVTVSVEMVKIVTGLTGKKNPECSSVLVKFPIIVSNPFGGKHATLAYHED
jgi:hypothetical protein